MSNLGISSKHLAHLLVRGDRGWRLGIFDDLRYGYRWLLIRHLDICVRLVVGRIVLVDYSILRLVAVIYVPWEAGSHVSHSCISICIGIRDELLVVWRQLVDSLWTASIGFQSVDTGVRVDEHFILFNWIVGVLVCCCRIDISISRGIFLECVVCDLGGCVSHTIGHICVCRRFIVDDVAGRLSISLGIDLSCYDFFMSFNNTSLVLCKCHFIHDNYMLWLRLVYLLCDYLLRLDHHRLSDWTCCLINDSCSVYWCVCTDDWRTLNSEARCCLAVLVSIHITLSKFRRFMCD